MVEATVYDTSKKTTTTETRFFISSLPVDLRPRQLITGKHAAPRPFAFPCGQRDYPSEDDTLNTAIRIAMATKPTTPAMATIRIGSRALVKEVMLRSMSFW